MGISYNPKVVVDQLVASIDASNLKSYSGSGSNIKNLVDNDSTNTLDDQVLVKSSRSENRTSNVVTDYSSGYFNNLNTSSKVSLSNISVDPSSGGFTICMLVKPQKVDDDVWGYWFKQQSSDNTKLVEFGTKTNDYFEFKDDVDEVYYGEAVFTDVGQHTWTVPTGVTQITAVCVGGGGGGGGKNYSIELGYGGAGGGLAYGTWSVTPGDVLYIQVGGGGSGGLSRSSDMSTTVQSGGDGVDSYIKITGHAATGNDIRLIGYGGSGGAGGNQGSAGEASGGGSGGLYNSNTGVGGNGGTGGGTEGGGGGGACGYNGSGGRGGNGGAFGTSSSAGAGGGGGGGGSSSGTSTVEATNYNSGGGVGIYGSGTNGAAGDHDAFPGGDSDTAGHGGSGGTDGSTTLDHQDGGGDVVANQYWLTGGGLYGGGGGAGLDGNNDTAPSEGSSHITSGRPGGQGAVRIIWGKTRSYPSTNVSEGLFPLNKTSIQIERGSWYFLTFGVTSDYRSFVSKNGAPKTEGSVSNWNNSEILTFSDIFGTGTSNFNCLWSNCMIYDKELTDAEIAQNYNAFTSKIYPPFQIVYQNIVLHLDTVTSEYIVGASTWYDVSGQQNDATIVTYLAYSLSTGGYFTYDWPGDQYMTLNQEVALTGDFTLEAWVYKEQTMTSNGTYSNIAGPAVNSSYSGAGGNAHNTQFHIDNGGAGKIGLVINATSVCNSTSTPVSLDTWHQLVWTRSGTTCKVYVDGVEHASGTNGDTAYVGNIGRYYITGGDSYAFIGRLSSVKLYDGKGLTSSEIMQNFNVLRGRYGI